MRIFFLQLSLLLGLFCISGFVCSQVTIGSAIPPNRGALLDLKEFEPKINNENSTKGLMLPRVSLNDISSLEGIEGASIATKDLYTGLIAYNVLDNALCGLGVGLYVWDGNKWESLDRSRVPAVKGSYAQDVAILKKIMDDNPNNTLNWVIDSSNPNDMKFISGTGVEFDEICGERRLNSLNVSRSNLSTLDLRGASTLKFLSCYNNEISSLDLSGLVNLESLSCYNNEISSLDLSGLVNLESLYCYYNEISSLDLSSLVNLKMLYCNSNQISSLGGLSGLVNLKSLNCGYNKISSLGDLSGLVNLESLNCGYNKISSLGDLSGLVNLESLNCNNNEISSLDLSDLVNLESLSCYNNEISSLDLSGLTKINSLMVGGNNFSEGSIVICKSVYDSSRLEPLKGDAIYRVVECN